METVSSALSVHPAANEFPMLSEDRLRELADDITINGQREAIKLFDGMVIDGRNRYAACVLAGIEPRTETLPDGIDPWAYVWSLNGQRRDITADQRYLIWKSCSEQSAAWQAQQQRIQDEANRKRSEAQAGITKDEIKERPATSSGDTLRNHAAEQASKSASAKAAASHTNRGAVERMDQLARERPDLAEQVKAGALPGAAAIREMKREAVVQRLEDIGAKEAKAASGIYDVIVIDPPWQMEKIERDERPNQSEFDYPTMDEAALSGLEIPTADDCHIWVWATHKHLPMALRLIDVWGFKYVCTFVWHKPGGFQPFGLPQYNCEFAIYCRKGTPQFIDFKAFPVCFNAPRGAHSAKPVEFYDIVRRVTAGRRLDMFSRRAIDGFSGWGNEAR